MKDSIKKVSKKGTGLFSEFKQFISRGNVLDLAVGVIIGAAFGKIVSSLVDNIIMPLVGLAIGGINFSGLTFNIKDATIAYGLFIQNVVDFLIVALCIFIFIKIINAFFRKKKEEEPAPIVKSDEAILLEEIRDLLKKKK
ncbi:MAG: large-conductance mechanosensitive channel protein MscL [Bacilli bacterium]|nr:large-conductance mechanosensitive channel protein MscL [Bacilli bacterium]